MVFWHDWSRGGQRAYPHLDHIHIPSSSSSGWTDEMKLNSEVRHIPGGILPRHSYPHLSGVGEA